MINAAAPGWLASLQAEFSTAATSGLLRSTGELTPDAASYSPALTERIEDGLRVAGRSRLAVYNRQYWFRLFTVLHAEYPLTARLFGFWEFNRIAEACLADTPPSGHDVARVADQLAAFVKPGWRARVARVSQARHVVPSRPPAESALPEGLAEAAFAVDRAWSTVLMSPPWQPYVVTQGRSPNLARTYLRLAPGVAIVDDPWELTPIRARLRHEEDAQLLAVPQRGMVDRPWLLRRTGAQVGFIALDRQQVLFLRRVASSSVHDAVEATWSDAGHVERTDLEARVQGWLADSMRWGIWEALD